MGYAYAKRMHEFLSSAYNAQYQCKFINVIPCNLYGKRDNFNLMKSHIIPGQIRKIYDIIDESFKKIKRKSKNTTSQHYLGLRIPKNSTCTSVRYIRNINGRLSRINIKTPQTQSELSPISSKSELSTITFQSDTSSTSIHSNLSVRSSQPNLFTISSMIDSVMDTITSPFKSMVYNLSQTPQT
jgi:hypothetical protein